MFEQQLGRSVTIDQAAELLQVSRRTIYNRIRDGKLLTIRTIGGSQRVLLSSVEDNRKYVWGLRAEPVEMLTTAAPVAPRPAQCRAKAWVSRKVPVTFTAKTRSQAAAGMSSSVPSG